MEGWGGSDVWVIREFTQERLHPGCYIPISITWKQREILGENFGGKKIVRNYNVLELGQHFGGFEASLYAYVQGRSVLKRTAET